MHTYIHTYIVNMNRYIHTYTHTRIHTYTHTHIHTYASGDVHKEHGHADIHTHIHTHMYTHVHQGTFMKNMDMTPYRAIVNCMAVNHDDVTVAGYDNGALRFMVCVAIECVRYRMCSL